MYTALVVAVTLTCPRHPSSDVAMYAVAKSVGGTRLVLIGGDFNVWLDSPGHPSTRRLGALWEECGFLRAGHSAKEDRQRTCEGHNLDSFLHNAPLVLWAMCELPLLASGRYPAALRSDHGLVVLGIPLTMAAKVRITRLAYSHAQGTLHAIRPDSLGAREAAAAVLQRACDDLAPKRWISLDKDIATVGTPAVQAVLDRISALRYEVSRVEGVCMPLGMEL